MKHDFPLFSLDPMLVLINGGNAQSTYFETMRISLMLTIKGILLATIRALCSKASGH